MTIFDALEHQKNRGNRFCILQNLDSFKLWPIERLFKEYIEEELYKDIKSFSTQGNSIVFNGKKIIECLGEY